MATARLVPSTYSVSNANYVTVTNPTNMYNNTDHTSDYATLQGRTRNSSTAYYAFIGGFNFNSIPDGSIVSSFSVKIRCYRNSYQRTGANYRLRLASTASNNSVIADTTLSTDLTTSSFLYTIPTGDITWNELTTWGSGFSVEVPLAGSSGSSAPQVLVYGVEIEVTYTLPVSHTITASTSTGTISPSGTSTVYEGQDFTLTITASSPIVTDNNVDVTSQLQRITSGTVGLIPDSHTSSGFTITNASNAYTAANSTTYATCTLAGRTTGNLYLNIESLNIPSSATIQSVSAQATLAVSRGGSSSSLTCSCQMYSGSTAKGSATTVTSTAQDISKTTYNLTVGSWTASEIADAKFYITMYNGASSTQRTLSVYGVTFSVTYSISDEIYTYTITNVVADHTIIVSAGQVVPVTGVSLDKATDTVEVGYTTTLTVTVAPSNASNKNVTWSTSSSSIATVSGGVVTGVAAGTARITVTTVDGGYTAYCDITVTPEVTYEYILTTTMEPGKTYLIANGNTGTVHLLTGTSGGSRQLVGLSVTISGNRISLTRAQKAQAEFECVRYTAGNDVTITVEQDGSYLYCDNSVGLRMNTPATLDRFWHYHDNKFWQFKSTISDGYSDASTEYKYYLTLSGSNFTDSHVDQTSIENSDIPLIYIFTPYVPSDDTIYFKNNGSWTSAAHVWKKVNGNWIEQTDLENVFSTSTNYVKG